MKFIITPLYYESSELFFFKAFDAYPNFSSDVDKSLLNSIANFSKKQGVLTVILMLFYKILFDY